MSDKTNKPVILTGLRANNDLHIGNYFGAILPLVEMAINKSEEYQVNIFVPDLHSFTTPIDYSKLQDQIKHNLRLYAAAGLPLDNSNVNIYRQSYIPAHSELTVILNNFTGFGEMKRMTQFKDKSGIQEGLSGQEFAERVERLIQLHSSNERMDREVFFSSLREALDEAKSYIESEAGSSHVSVGLFNYPILMAADILLYGASYVPIGDDQTQHLEITRDIGQRLNTKFDEDIFLIPKPVKEQHEFFGKDQGLRIKDLQNPNKKMSKSDESEKGIIFLGDEPKTAAKKIMSATTDDLANIQYDLEYQPGISNLLQILALLQSRPLDEVIDEFSGMSNYGDFKSKVAGEVEEFLSKFQTKLAQVDESQLHEKLTISEKKMNQMADATLNRVQRAIGLR